MKAPHTHLVDALFAFSDSRPEPRSPRIDRRAERADKEERERRRKEADRWARRSAARNGFGD